MDSLSIDTLTLHSFQQNPDFDYEKEWFLQDDSLVDWIVRQLEELFTSFLNSRAYQWMGPKFWLIMGLLFLIGIALYIFFRHPNLFRRKSVSSQLKYEVTEDTIYGIDFKQEIEKALASQNYREAARLIYLQKLRELSDANRIEWRLYKTPTQYTREETSDNFRKLTNHFLRIRYGNFNTTEALCKEMIRLAEGIEV